MHPVNTRNGHPVRRGTTLPAPRSSATNPDPESVLGARVVSPTAHTAIISLNGEIDLSTVPRLRSLVHQNAPRAIDLLIIDLSEIQFCDSAGLELLDECATRSAARGTDFRVVYRPDGPVARLFALVEGRMSFAHYTSMDEACVTESD